MANRRTIAREIAAHTGLEPRQTEKILGLYFAVLAAAAKSGVGLGRLGHITFAERPGPPEAHRRWKALRFWPSKGLRLAAKRGTLPPRVKRHLEGR